jgi:hypothetical protein
MCWYDWPKEPLINSEPFSCVGKMRQLCIPAGDAAMRRSELDRSGAPGPALRYFNQQILIHELIRGSLSKCH